MIILRDYFKTRHTVFQFSPNAVLAHVRVDSLAKQPLPGSARANPVAVQRFRVGAQCSQSRVFETTSAEECFRWRAVGRVTEPAALN